MGSKFKYLLISVLAVLAISACTSQIHLGDPAPNFILPDINGKSVSLQDFHGKPVVLYLWSASCLECVKDLAEIQSLNNCIDNNSIKFLTINQDDSSKYTKDYLIKNGYSFTVLFDIEWKIWKLYTLPKMAVPYTIIVGSDGKIKNIVAGNTQGYGGLKKLVGEALNITWDKTPPQISEINLSAASILSWKTDKKTKSSLQGIQVDGKGTGWDVTEDWTTYHRVDITSMKTYGYDNIKIIAMDYCGNAASAIVPKPVPPPNDDLSFSVRVNDDGSLSYQEGKMFKIQFVNGGTKKYVCSGTISNNMHNIVTVGWNVFLVHCPYGGDKSVFTAADEVTIDGTRSTIVKIPISIDGNAPTGMYGFKIVFYGL